MNIIIKNCNNIDYGEVKIAKNKLNIFYAINGTGKSTIAKAIMNKIESLCPFKYMDSINKENKPDVEGNKNIGKIDIFDEDFVSQFLFQPDELVKDSFDIFINSNEYKNQFKKIEKLVKDAKEIFENDSDLNNLIANFYIFINGFGKSKKGYSKAGSMYKAIGKGNKIYNIPEELQAYKKYVENTKEGTNVKWIKWHLSGNNFMDITDTCPYCAEKTNENIKETIQKVSKEFNPIEIGHLNKLLEVFDNLKNYFSESTNKEIKEISNNISGMSDEQLDYLVEVNKEVVDLQDKLVKINNLSYPTLKGVKKVIEEISKYKVDLDTLHHLNSEHTISKINIINGKIDNLISRIVELQKAVGEQNKIVKDTINKYSKEINGFLEYAGYKYKVSLEEEGGEPHKLKLKHLNMDKSINEADLHLSYGERNAFALVLFMYKTLKNNPDVIILDDPISSFDGNKKYAILHKLFKEDNSFKNKTVILLTHEFNTIIDMIYNELPEKGAVANYIENKKGILEIKEVKKEDIKSFISIAKENIESEDNIISKMIYMRRLVELEKNKEGNAWQLLSNLFKDKRSTPVIIEGNRKTNMTEEEINIATEHIKTYIPDFDYYEYYEKMHDKDYLLERYQTSNSNYEKLHIYRILRNKNSDNKVIKKFVNETFHIENDYLFQLNPLEFEVIPDYVIKSCDKDIEKDYPTNKIKKKIELFELPASAGKGTFSSEDSKQEVIRIDDIDSDFAVWISGDSMEPDILHGSIAIINKQEEVREGDIGVFFLNGENYCKKLGKEEWISLNEKYEPIKVGESDNFEIQGKVVRVILPSEIEEEVEYI
ncbi:S24 family peptidase [Miniphocaeibacter massiliensis]|uniref:S24 family peptidase n=1 Tax=Miniphocaeibacter massiliensis TaxID=2041841 RepID=UPI000C1C7B82|nr:S24 family peptidase [Miniphocaeibacter massiliensis]